MQHIIHLLVREAQEGGNPFLWELAINLQAALQGARS